MLVKGATGVPKMSWYEFESYWFDVMEEFSRGQWVNKCGTFSVHYYIVAIG